MGMGRARADCRVHSETAVAAIQVRTAKELSANNYLTLIEGTESIRTTHTPNEVEVLRNLVWTRGKHLIYNPLNDLEFPKGWSGAQNLMNTDSAIYN